MKFEFQLGQRYPLLIGGKEVDTGLARARFGQSRARARGSSGRRPWRVSNRRPPQSPRLAAAFPAWAATAAADRAAILIKAAAIMRKRRFELAAWEIL